MSHPPAEPDGDAVSTFLVQQVGEHTSVETILPSATLPTSNVAYLFLVSFFSTRSAHTRSLSLQMQSDGERTDILIEVYDLRSGLISCQAASSVTPRLRISVYSISHRGQSRRLYQSARCWRDAPQLSRTLVFNLFVLVHACVGVGPTRPPSPVGLRAEAETTKTAGFVFGFYYFFLLFFFCCSAIHK